jgi:hypothetical protein
VTASPPPLSIPWSARNARRRRYPALPAARTAGSAAEAGLEAGVDDGGSEAGGSEEGGSEDGGVDEGGSEDGGADDGGAEDGGAEEGGADDGGADEGGAEDDGGAEDGGADEDLPGLADPELPGWTGAELIGVGARVVPVSAAGLMNELGDSEAGAEGNAPGAAGRVPGAVAVAFAFAVLPAAACGWTLLAGGVRPAPIRAMAATADPATRTPVRPAEASGREMRCRP